MAGVVLLCICCGQAAAAVPQVAAGAHHAVAVTREGRLLGWGSNMSGALGTAVAPRSKAAEPVWLGFDGVRTIAAGENFSLAVRDSDGTVWQWGDAGGPPQLRGDMLIDLPRREAAQAPAQVKNLDGVIAVAAGRYAVALRQDGTVWTWGQGGLAGNGSPRPSGGPQQAVGLSEVVAVAASDLVTLALRRDGSVWAWGDNHSDLLWPAGGEPGQPLLRPARVRGLEGIKAIALNDTQALALQQDGTVWAWGALIPGTDGGVRYSPVKLAGLDHVVAIFARYHTALAIQADRSLWSWGRSELLHWQQYHQRWKQAHDRDEPEPRYLPERREGMTGVAAAALGGDQDVYAALKYNGEVWAWDGLEGNRSCPCPHAYPIVDPDGRGILNLNR